MRVSNALHLVGDLFGRLRGSSNKAAACELQPGLSPSKLVSMDDQT